MAYTVTRQRLVMGNKRMEIMEIDADAATQAIATTLGVIEGFALGPISMNSAAKFTIEDNEGALGTAIAGSLGLSGFTDGDHFFLHVFGH